VTPLVLVHGNPEIDAIWDPLVAALEREPIRLSPPGFGAPVPDGFDPTPEAYRAWLADELEAIGEPVDLVGHDWGGGHALTVAMTRPDLLRTWVSDLLGCFDPDYVWHPLAQGWQTPGKGEEMVATMVTDPSSRLDDMASRGLHRAVGEQMARGYDETMARAILDLYRDAAQPAMARLGANLPAAAARPGLAVLATEDRNVGTDEMRRRAAARAGARVVVLDGLGHWWMVQDPRRAAGVLDEFWSSAAR
jgi:pimeloyl-ACP methyl ester carboxylesterase